MEDVGVSIFTYFNSKASKKCKIFSEIVRRTVNLEEGALKPIKILEDGPTIYQIFFETKYYTTHIQFWFFEDLFVLKNWQKKKIKNLLAFIVSVDIEEITDKFINELDFILKNFEIDTRILLLSNNCCSNLTTHTSTIFNTLSAFCTKEGIELVELKPDKATKQILREYNESYGVKRLLEILSTISWPNLNKKANPTQNPEHLNRVKNLIKKLEIEKDYKKTAYEEEKYIECTSDDEIEILHYFGHILNDFDVFPRNAQNKTMPKLQITENSKNYGFVPLIYRNFSNMKRIHDYKRNFFEAKKEQLLLNAGKDSMGKNRLLNRLAKNNVNLTLNESDLLDWSTEKKNSVKNCLTTKSLSKNKRYGFENWIKFDKNISPNLENSFAENGLKNDIKLSEAFDGVLKENSSISSPIPLDCKCLTTVKNDDVFSMIEKLNALKDQTKAFNKKTRVSLTSEISLSVLRNLTKNDSSSCDKLNFNEFNPLNFSNAFDKKDLDDKTSKKLD